MKRKLFFIIGALSIQLVKGQSGDSVKKDSPKEKIEYELNLIKDPALGYAPTERLRPIRNTILQQNAQRAIQGVVWQERGPSNIGGRTRTLMYDPNDITQKKVWAGGVSGGLWYNNDITSSTSGWIRINDFWDDIAVTSIAYNPLNTQEFYVGTGEGWNNLDAYKGMGIWKTSDGGTTWTNLTSTSTSDFFYIQKIVVHPVTGDIYVATKNKGVMRSQDGGTTWTQVLGLGVGALQNTAADLEIGADNTIYASIGIYNTDGIYSSTTGNLSSWTKLNTGANGFPTTGFSRIEFATAPSNANLIYAMAQSTATSGLLDIYKSTDHGLTWTIVSKPIDTFLSLGNDFTRNQAFYDFAIGIDPNDDNTVFVGGINSFKSIDGGSNWTQISAWTGYPQFPPSGPYASMHCDFHSNNV